MAPIHMKYIYSIFIGSLLLAACNANDAQSGSATATNHDSIQHAHHVAAAADSANFTSLQWMDSTSQNLGTIREGQSVEVSWRFKNTGTKPLIITQATASCGCTVAEKPQAPIAPGDEGVIKAKFDSQGRVGLQNKEVYVEANTSGERSHRLTFALEVQQK